MTERVADNSVVPEQDERQAFLAERRRREVVNLIFIMFYLLIFEGSLRKWVFPSLHQYLFFIRDPFLLRIYYLTWADFPVLFQHPILSIGSKIAGLACFLPFLIENFSPSHVLLFLYGWRNYFLYLPLPFIIYKYFRRDDLESIIRHSFYIAIPSAVLTVEQSFLPDTHPLNQGSDPAFAFKPLPVGLGFYRPQGWFSSVAGQNMYIASTLSLCIGAWISPSRTRIVGNATLLAATLAVTAMLGVSGSRGAFFLVLVIMVLSQLIGLIILRGASAAKAFGIPFCVSLVGIFFITYFYADPFNALMVRAGFQDKIDTGLLSLGEIIYRPLVDMQGALGLVLTVPIGGYGLGTGGNAVVSYGIDMIAEGELGRQLVDLGPLLGIGYFLLRCGLTLQLGRIALVATRRANDPLPLFFFFFIAIIFLNGHLTAQGSIHGYGWMFAGFSMVCSATTLAEAEEKEKAAMPARRP